MPDTIELNGHEYTPDQVQQAVQVINRSVPSSSSTLETPSSIRSRFGRQYDGDRDIYDTLGYEENPEFDDYHAKYKRGDIAPRIIELPAQDTWREPPRVTDQPDAGEDSESQSPFELAVESFFETRFNSIARRLDIAAGIGEYGLLVFGFTDGAESFQEDATESAFTGDTAEDIAYLSIFNQGDVTDWQLGRDVGRPIDDPRYNRPVEYDIDFGEHENDTVKTVHWSRVVHVPATEPVFSDLRASPRLERVYNRLEDLEKVVGAAAEAAWHGADRKFHFDIRDAYQDSIDTSEMSDEVMKLVHDLQPYIKTTGTDLEVISGEQVDPSGVVDSELKLIAGARGIPQRKLVGSERGEQASTQDRANWFDDISSRMSNYAEEFILRPVVDRLILLGILPPPANEEYVVEWPNLFELNPVEESEVEYNRARAAKNAAPQGNTDLLPGGMDGTIEYVQEGSFPESPEPAVENPDPIEELEAANAEGYRIGHPSTNGDAD